MSLNVASMISLEHRCSSTLATCNMTASRQVRIPELKSMLLETLPGWNN
jgi:hypothetical protein